MELKPKDYPNVEKGTYCWWEGIDEEGYFYEIYVCLDGNEAEIIVTNEGVSIEFRNSKLGFITTNIKPNRLFPKLKKLEWKHLNRIITILESTGFEGRSYSEKESEELYRQFLNEFPNEENKGE